MPRYELTFEAEQDLLDIAMYTIEKWGLEQANRYEAAFVRHFEALSKGEALTKAFLPYRPELQVCRVEHHYVFSLSSKNSPILIIAISHEKMDLVARLHDRLEST